LSFIDEYLPIDLRKAWVSDSVLDISRDKISEPANMVKGVSSPKLLAIPILITVNVNIEEGFDLRNGGLSSSGLSSDKHSTTGDLSISDHVKDDTGSASSLAL